MKKCSDEKIKIDKAQAGKSNQEIQPSHSFCHSETQPFILSFRNTVIHLVIPNRAESPVRNLLFAGQTSDSSRHKATLQRQYEAQQNHARPNHDKAIALRSAAMGLD
jgi:hypothetical protein